MAGIVGSAGGITSLIAYPALLAVGIPALPANVTMSVAYVVCGPGSALNSRPELRGQAAWLRRWAPLVAVGSVAGSVLLLNTPRSIFDGIVPFLLLAAAVALLVQPRLSAWQERTGRSTHRAILPLGLLFVAIYNGYFGAGSGVMTLALLLFTVHTNLPRANALKNVLLGLVDLVTAVIFICFGPVDWRAAVPLAIGLLAGSMIGPSLTRRVPSDVVRVLVALAGIGLAIRLWVVPAH